MALDNRSTVRKVLLITLLLNLFVMGLKGVVGFWTGSLSLQADALHSVTDSANNVLGLIASRFSSPQPDRDHPYGHQKFEAVGALGIAAFLGIACFEILQGAIQRIFQGLIPVNISAPERDIASRGLLGRQVFIEMHMIVDAKDVETAHKITEEVEARLEERFSPVRVLIHVEPPAYQSNQVSFEQETTWADKQFSTDKGTFPQKIASFPQR